MRAFGRLTFLVVVSSGTITCLAKAQTSAPPATHPPLSAGTAATLPLELVDPWSDEAPEARSVPAWASEVRSELEIVDPWSSSSRSIAVGGFEMIEVVDPWSDGERRVPTAAFPLVHPAPRAEPRK